MYLKMVWSYVFILTLLDISLNTKLTAQGKSHGVTVQDPLRFIERIPFQEGAAGRGPAAPADALLLSPAALDFGRCSLARPHVLTVTLTNTHNGTMHLASVAGTTTDFHASFFESKTLPPAANTSFSVVYLGRREGLAAAHLYIHTSLGVVKYPVSAEGAASEWDVWPLVDVRVPHNATVDPLLTMHNPTDHTIQVSEVYSSGAWLGLQLPEGGAAAGRALWTLPPHTTRPLVRLRPRVPPAAPPAPLTAYVRIKATVPGGALVVPVEARAAPPGDHLQPLQLRLRPRGARDPPLTRAVLAGSSADGARPVHAALWAARCHPQPHATPPPPDPADAAHLNGQADDGTANGVKSEGVHVSLLRSQFDPYQPLTPTAQVTFDFAKMWETYMSDMEAEGAAAVGAAVAGAAGAEAWCAGWVRVGRAALPYSVKLLPGTLRLVPDTIHVVTADLEEAFREREVRVHNEFPWPLRLLGVELGPGVKDHFHVSETGVGVVAGGGTAILGTVRLTKVPSAGQLDSWLAVRTNGTEYRLPLRLHGGRLALRWRWPAAATAAGGELRLGALPASSTHRVRLQLHNPTPEELCVRELRVELPGAQLALDEGGGGAGGGGGRCAAAGGQLSAWLTVVAPARPGPLRGSVLVRTQHAASHHNVSLHALAGRLTAHAIIILDAAPYATAPMPLVVESTMAITMRAIGLHHDGPDPDMITFTPHGEAVISMGQRAVGSVQFAAETLCRPHCYTGLHPHSPEGEQWMRRSAAGSAGGAAALAADAALYAARRALYAGAAPPPPDTLHLETTQVLRLAVPLVVRPHWPALAAAPAPPPALAGVGGAAPILLTVRNPSATHALLLQPLFADGTAPATQLFSGAESPQTVLSSCGADCVWDSSVFTLSGWRVHAGAARVYDGSDAPAAPSTPRALPLLLLEPRAEILLDVTFTPTEAASSVTYLYLRNNLTIVEPVVVTGRGVFPSFELAGRRPGDHEPITFEVRSCSWEAGPVRRTVVVRNTGAVPLRLRDWRLAGRACAARGFRLQPCAALALRPNESRPLGLAFSPDYTLARVGCTLTVAADTGHHEFRLAAAAAARLLPACAAAAPPPPFDGALRAAGTLLAVAALALVLAAAALDAERELRRARADRPPPPPAAAHRRPLDLRACHAPVRATPSAAAAVAPRRRRPPRRAQPLDPQAERRAFERWRAEVLRRSPTADGSGDEPDAEPDADRPPLPPAAADESKADDDTGSTDDDSSHSSPPDDRFEPDDRSEPEEPDDADEPDDRDDDAAHVHIDHTIRDEKDAECRWATEEGSIGMDAIRVGPGASVGAGGSVGRRAAPRARPGSARSAARRDKPARRRPPAVPHDLGCHGFGAGLAPAPAPLPRHPRRAATWSEVVAEGCAAATAEAAREPGGEAAGEAAREAAGEAGARLAPIGSDVRRRGAHSLFYFNESPPPAEPSFAWRPQPQDAFAAQPAHLYREESNRSVGAVGSGGAAYSAPGSVWGAGGAAPGAAAAAWLWGGYGEPALRPPPGFGAAPRQDPPPPPAAAPPPRPYDPFRSLAAIWGPAALDWRPARPPRPDDEPL